jgi:sugar phosphate isomerase/epimerase
MKIGLQTYTCRSVMKNEQEIDKTFALISGMGIKHIELAVDYLKMPFTQKTAALIAKIANNHGIETASCQIRYNTAAKDTKFTAEFMHILGAEYVSNSVIDLSLLKKGKEGVLRYCEQLNRLDEKLKQQGIFLSHHNHHYEFLKFEEKTVLELMRQNFSGLFTIDTYWCQKGGGNILTLLEDFRGRVPILHLRDYKLKPTGLVFGGGTDCEAGKGNLPFMQILEKAKWAGVKFGMIEQSTKTPIESIKSSAEHLFSLLSE